MRVFLGCLVAVLAGALFGLIMGEYQLLGFMAILAGLLFGLAVAEAAITTAKSSDWVLVGVTAASAFGGLMWAAYIEAGQDFGRVAGVRWLGGVVALLSAGWWVRALGSRAIRSPFDEELQEPEPTP